MDNLPKLDKRKIRALEMSERGVSAEELTNKFSDVLDGIAELQKEFQEKYCPTCANYSPAKNKTFLNLLNFLNLRRSSDFSDCKLHYTDILGQCWNYSPKKQK